MTALCEAPDCDVSGADTCVTWGHRLCYPHFADWMQGKAAHAGRPPTEIEWAAFLGWVAKQRDANDDGQDAKPAPAMAWRIG